VIAGAYDAVIACGIEHMTRVPMGSAMTGGFPFTPQLLARYDGNLVPQGISAELLAADWDLGREELDDFGYRSHTLAGQATAEGRFRKEIFPVKIEGAEGSELFETDQGIRYPSDRAKMASLLSPFFNEEFAKQFPEIRWVVTAGNSSQITDGASWTILASEEAVRKHGLTPKAVIVDSQWSALDPSIMGLGPVLSATTLLKRNSLTLQDVETWELNEAFATQVLGCLAAWNDEKFCREILGLDGAAGQIDHAKLNVDGGAISLGHPVGTSGNRIVLHLVNAMKRLGARRGVATECIGGGLGGAMLIETV